MHVACLHTGSRRVTLVLLLPVIGPANGLFSKATVRGAHGVCVVLLAVASVVRFSYTRAAIRARLGQHAATSTGFCRILCMRVCMLTMTRGTCMGACMSAGGRAQHIYPSSIPYSSHLLPMLVCS
jgi:hypothetical protein